MAALLVRSVAIASFVLMTLIRGCFDSSTDNGDIPPGAYSYTGYDSTGVKIVTGWLDFELVDEENIEGSWELKPVGNPGIIGPQIGEGNLEGTLKDNVISINLNPAWVDNNVLLYGEYAENRITGDWQWVTIAGPTNEGTFEAVR